MRNVSDRDILPFRSRRQWGLLVFALVSGSALACGGNGNSAADAGGGGGADANTGIDGATQADASGADVPCLGKIICSGTIAYTCGQPPSSGTDCAAKSLVCAPDIGCAACVPGAISCSATDATYCRSDGSGVIEFACDSALGLTCQGNACVGACAPSAIEDSYIGCEYFPTTGINDVNNSFMYQVAVANGSTTGTANVTVTGGALTSPVTAAVAPGQVQVLTLPWVPSVKVCNQSSLGNGFDQVNACSANNHPDYGSRVVPGGAYRLASTLPVAVYQYAPIQASDMGVQAGTTEGSLLIPQTTFGKQYRVATYGQGFARGGVVVVATVDDTTITVQPTSDVTAGAGYDAGVPAGQSASYKANRGDVVEIVSATAGSTTDTGDLTGTLVSSDHPVEVMGEHGCAWVIDAQSCDHIEDSMFPAATFGTDYLVKAATYPGSIGYVARVVALADNTTVTFDPPSVSAPQVLAKAGALFDLAATDIVAHLTSNQPVLVAGLNEGDNTLALFVPTARFRTDYLVYAPTFQNNWLRLFATTGSTVQVDGTGVAAATWSAIGASGYSWAMVPVQTGPHRVASTKPFGVMVFGHEDANYVPQGLPSAYEYAGGLDVRQAAGGTSQ